ncbi:MAG TPA: hypothetical protein V6D33_15410 [Cyanophyceae cyanobacterium]
MMKDPNFPRDFLKANGTPAKILDALCEEFHQGNLRKSVGIRSVDRAIAVLRTHAKYGAKAVTILMSLATIR